ncbi:MAG TPA: esterase [Mycobacterium sp.]|uniref:alpha/beta hydrolase n=1 Tax=Mycobacterium sp. TaxID=1785 RepID=UPI002C63A0B3|nr:esterase [Mycobacterium sp.]HXO81115.1 esterase [Mycobacterium sp.]
METVEYAAGRLADVFGEPSQPTVLLWHGQQPDARSSVRPLAELIAGHGLGVIAPDWDSSAHDGGRADLLDSVHFARERVDHPDSLVLAGWSMGGLAAAALTVQAQRLGVAFGHTVCLAGAFMVPDPIFNELPATRVNDGAPRSPFTLLHGVADRVVPLSVADDFAAALRQHDWPVQVVELPADHGSIAGAVYDARAGRYRAAIDAKTLAVAADVAARIADAGRPIR